MRKGRPMMVRIRVARKTKSKKPTGRRKTSTPCALTPRQNNILRLVAEGLTNREIAAHLKISVRTVEVHRFNLMRRLQVRNVAQLLRQALSLRLLPKSFAS
ncbi:MAG: response regulator transcription factor [Nitrospirae bacterium]|nr:response regulator transcription factor [Nitrospirota bacterium]